MTEVLTPVQILDKIRERLYTMIEDKSDRNPKKYCDNEIQARQDIIDDCEWAYDDQMCMLINELLWRL